MNAPPVLIVPLPIRQLATVTDFSHGTRMPSQMAVSLIHANGRHQLAIARAAGVRMARIMIVVVVSIVRILIAQPIQLAAEEVVYAITTAPWMPARPAATAPSMCAVPQRKNALRAPAAPRAGPASGRMSAATDGFLILKSATMAESARGVRMPVSTGNSASIWTPRDLRESPVAERPAAFALRRMGMAARAIARRSARRMQRRACLLRIAAEVRVRMGCAGRVEVERNAAMERAKARNPAVLARKIVAPVS